MKVIPRRVHTGHLSAIFGPLAFLVTTFGVLALFEWVA